MAETQILANDYGIQETAMAAYREAGEARARALGNRVPFAITLMALCMMRSSNPTGHTVSTFLRA